MAPAWSAVLASFREGDLAARDRIARLVIGTLRASGAYRWRDSWEDVLQDVFLTLLEQNPQSGDDRAVAAWIRRVVTHRFVDGLRKEQGRRRAGRESTVGWRRNVPLEESRLFDSEAFEETLWHDLAGAMAALDERLRSILECKYALGCTDEEGAARLGESVGTYKRLARQALAQLRQALLEDVEKLRIESRR